MSDLNMIAFDFGATSGRGLLYSFDGEKLNCMDEHRFGNENIEMGGTLYWNVLSLYGEILNTICKFREYQCVSMGIDAWGMDFGILDSSGKLMENPVSYRDHRTDGIAEILHKKVSNKVIYEGTGQQFLPNSTIYQLYALLIQRPEFLERAKNILMIPDLFKYFLSGEIGSEYTISTTTELFDIRTGNWNKSLIHKVGLNTEWFSEIEKPGVSLRPLLKSVKEQCNCKDINLVTTASHDTASAMIAVPAQSGQFVFISSGTWSVIGTELRQPIIHETAMENNWANEGGYDSIRFCKSLMGMWILEECRRQSTPICGMDFDCLISEAKNSRPFRSLIDPQNPRFSGRCNMYEEICGFCEESGQPVPQSAGELTRCIFESMVLNYFLAFTQLEELTGNKYENIHIVGGGARNGLLSQMLADCTGCSVIAGPAEATAMGNIFEQMLVRGEVKSLSQFRELISNSSPVRVYRPQSEADGWLAGLETYKKYKI